VGFLDACEREVGLPVGQIGNSEVGAWEHEHRACVGARLN
jgi:bisphosphoglycerate-independent phosphoglycerate mutase (AlkP superfamily)